MIELKRRAIALSATFTAEPIQPSLAFWADLLGLDCEIHFAGYNQLFQELLDPAGLFAHNCRGFNVVLVRFEDWEAAGVAASADRLADAIRNGAGAFSGPLIVVECPSRTPAAVPARQVRDAVAGIPSVHWISAAEVASLYPVSEVHDPHSEELGHVPYTPVFYAALATAIARKIHAITALPFKAIAVDCDDTLWSGVCGEDGPQGVTLDAPHLALQQFLAERRREGMLLALSSKNNEEDVVETFRAHPEMPLRLEDFIARRVNWGMKSTNLASLAEELELGLGSFILLDDSPKECREAQAGAPEVLALPLPERTGEIPEFLRHVWAFDRARVTEEDRRRADFYGQRLERVRAARASGSLEEFLTSLELDVTMAPMRPDEVTRVAQLTQRTNQMNATLKRRTEGEIQALDGECWTVRVRDRFGDYGLTGVMIFRCGEGALVVDTFLLSCRALGRGVEHRMVAKLGEIALGHGLSRVEIPFVRAPRNRPVELFLESIGGGRLGAGEAAAVEYRPGIAELPTGETVSPEAPRKTIDYLRIATELRDPETVLRLAGAPAAAVAPRPVVVPPRTPLERDLAELWADLLHVPVVGIHDNFFEMGGHSLLAVQLLSRVRRIYGVELSLEVVYSGDFTVAELAKAVELKEIERAGGDYQELVRELAGLSDEEARALLAQEQDAD